MTFRTSPGGGHQLDEHSLHERHQRFITDKRPSPAPMVVAVGIRTPENLGSIMRQADAAGSHRLLLVDTACAIDNKKIARIARSTDKHLTIDYVSMERLIQLIPELPPLVAVEITSDSVDLFQARLPASCCLVMGAERHGIPDALLAHCYCAVHIPMYGINTSMNVSHALTLALYEWRRQHPV